MNIPHRACTVTQGRPLALLCLALASAGCAGSEASADDPLSGVARTRIDAGERQTCWIRAGGAIRCEGVALRGTSRREDGSFVKVSVGDDAACGLREDGSVRCFFAWLNCGAPGCSLAGTQIGSGRDIRRDLPGRYLDIDLRGDGREVLALDTDGHVLRWDPDWMSGSLGDFDAALAAGGFAPPPPNGGATDPAAARTDFVRIAGNGLQSCGLSPSGQLRCWTSDVRQLYEPPGTFAELSSGHAHLCARTVEGAGTVHCWGADEDGQAADVKGRFVEVSAGGSHTCALRESGRVTCWGDGSHVPTSPSDGTFIAVAAGGGHSCGLREGDQVECWGFGAGLPAATPSEGVEKPIGTAVADGCTSLDGSSPARFACELAQGYLSTFEFTKVNATEFTQAFGATKQRNIWISPSESELPDSSPTAKEIYGAIDPDDPEARILAAILPGTRLLHENPGGDRYELMTKLPPGAAPENGDWGFSRHLLDGTRLPLTSDSGYGPAAPTCLDCHEMANRRERTDLLWGIPRSAMP